MNDLRFPGLRGATLLPSPTDGVGRKAVASEPVTFDRAMERSVNAGQRADEPARERSADRSDPRNTQRNPERTPDRVVERVAQRVKDDPPARAAPRSDERSNDDTRRVADTAQAVRRETMQDTSHTDGVPASDTEPSDKKADPASGSDAIANTSAAPQTVPPTDAAGADATIALLAASTALSGAKTAMTVADEPFAADPLAADASIDGDGVAVPGASARPDAATRNGKLPKAAANATAAAEPAVGKTRPGALPELTADLTRTPAKDRLLEDFERRFENSLARAAGVNGQSPLNSLGAGGPLASAGLPANMQAPGTPLTVAHATVSTPIGHPAFGADLAHRVLLFAGQRVQSAQITVTPNELGPISVSIEMQGQEASIQFSATHATTRAAIEDAMPRLREMLAAQGLQLTQADVGDHAQRDARATYSERQASRGADGNGAVTGTATVATREAERITLRRVGLIDIRV